MAKKTRITVPPRPRKLRRPSGDRDLAEEWGNDWIERDFASACEAGGVETGLTEDDCTEQDSRQVDPAIPERSPAMDRWRDG
jgi:hypothetical protein